MTVYSNACAVRWVKSVKEEALSRMILFGERSLRHVLGEYMTHYHAERPHQGKGNVILFPSAQRIGDSNAIFQRRFDNSPSEARGWGRRRDGSRLRCLEGAGEDFALVTVEMQDAVSRGAGLGTAVGEWLGKAGG